MVAALLAGLAPGVTHAQEPKADCAMFHKMGDGRWTSKIKSKVGNPKDFVTLEPGLPIDPKLSVAGLNVSDTIEHLCGGK